MKTFISSATAFYILAPGEKLSRGKMNPDISRMYVIYQDNLIWTYRYKWINGWEKPTDDVFSTENDALNSAYDHFLLSKIK
ncbi:hypothetical protein [Rosenbergiella collisarenosi]|uniref:hypothetical protein n=1 Tax=Rosenbergiella collisarenosi TaxID=1544695 RepID=UPI001F4D6E9C|nr:hypothetical protein [Rosenbergiella collisarenosi]